jgi:hypothetical protein
MRCCPQHAHGTSLPCCATCSATDRPRAGARQGAGTHRPGPHALTPWLQQHRWHTAARGALANGGTRYGSARPEVLRPVARTSGRRQSRDRPASGRHIWRADLAGEAEQRGFTVLRAFAGENATAFPFAALAPRAPPARRAARRSRPAPTGACPVAAGLRRAPSTAGHRRLPPVGLRDRPRWCNNW